MKESTKDILITTGCLSVLISLQFAVAYLFIRRTEPYILRIDCRTLIGDWHPDIPPKVLEECRKLNSPKGKL